MNSTFKDAQGIAYVVTKATTPYEARVLGGLGNPNNTVQVNNPVIPATVSNNGYNFAVAGIQSSAFTSSTPYGTLTIQCSGIIGPSAFSGCTGLTGTLTIP
ncbi:MAG: hypothetical protein LBT35_01140, partial [Tannerella sp.]|nr:hypothetical protein [Tannerella sp.]